MQDLRKLFQEENKLEKLELPKGHQEKFRALLEEQLPREQKNKSFLFLKVAASLALLISLGWGAYEFFTPEALVTVVEAPEIKNSQQKTATPQQLTLGDISPDLKKIETYYVANINLELASMDVNKGNKALFDGYIGRLGKLNDEYQKLTLELNQVGPNEQTVTALINNLQLRLQLLQRLKEKLNELKNQDNETLKEEQV